MFPQTPVGFLRGIQKQGHILDLAQNTAHHPLRCDLVASVHGDIDVESAAGLPVQRLRREIRMKSVPGRNGFDHRTECHSMIRRTQGIGIAKIDLILSGTFLVVGGFRLDPHPLQSKADLPADIFAFVFRGHIHVACMVIGNIGGFPILVQFEQIELQFRAEGEGIACFRRICDGTFQNASGVVGEPAAIRIGDGTHHPHHPAMLRPPGKHRNGGGVRVQKQVGMNLVAEACDGRCIDGDAIAKSPFQLLGHDRDVFWLPMDITKCQTDELDILLFDVLHDFLWCVFHIEQPAFCAQFATYICL